MYEIDAAANTFKTVSTDVVRWSHACEDEIEVKAEKKYRKTPKTEIYNIVAGKESALETTRIFYNKKIVDESFIDTRDEVSGYQFLVRGTLSTGP